MPEASEIPTSKLQEVRRKLVARERRHRPDLDTRPNSVYGDLFLNPAAEDIAAIEIAWGRFMSDLDPENTSKGIIWNCDFVEAYLKNFAVDALSIPEASGYVILEFSEDKAYTLEQSLRFRFNSEDVFEMDLPYPGSLSLQPTDAAAIPGVNSISLRETSPGVYSVILRLKSTTTASVDLGDSAEVNTDIPELISVTSIQDFRAGSESTSTSKKSELVQKTAYSATPNSRGGAQLVIHQNLPEITMASAVLSGDAEMVRTNSGPLGIKPGLMDIHVRQADLLTRTDSIRIDYYEDQGGNSLQKFIGKLDLIQIPALIESVSCSGHDFTIGNDVNIYGRSLDEVRAPMASSANSELQELWLIGDMPTSGGLPNITTTVDSGGQPYAVFDITYKYDPSLRAALNLLKNVGDMPWLDILVRGTHVAQIESMDLTYRKDASVALSLDQARVEITEHINAASYPDGIVEAVIGDILYYAGASKFLKTEITSKIHWSAANYYVPGSEPTPDVACANFMAEAVAIPPLVVNSLSSFDFLLLYTPGSGTDPQTKAGPRTVSFLINPDNIKFVQK